MNKNLIVERSD